MRLSTYALHPLHNHKLVQMNKPTNKYKMANEMMSDPAFQSQMKPGTVIGPSTTPSTTPTPTPTSALRMHATAAASSSTTPAPSAASSAGKEPSPASTTIVVSGTPAVTSKGPDPKEKDNLLGKLPVIGQLTNMLGLGR